MPPSTSSLKKLARVTLPCPVGGGTSSVSGVTKWCMYTSSAGTGSCASAETSCVVCVPMATATSAGNGDSNRRLTLTTCPGASATEGERHLTENSSGWFPVGTRGSQPPGKRDCCVVGAWWSCAEEAGAEEEEVDVDADDDTGPSRRWCFAAGAAGDDDDDVAIDFSAAKCWPCSIGTAGTA